MRAVSPQKSGPTFRGSHRKCDRKNTGNGLEKNSIKRADPRKHKELNQQKAEQQIVSQPSRSQGISQAEPSNTSSEQQHKKVLPFFAHNPCRSGIIGNKLRNTNLKTRYRPG